jgi:hypothetical protein
VGHLPTTDPGHQGAPILGYRGTPIVGATAQAMKELILDHDRP